MLTVRTHSFPTLRSSDLFYKITSLRTMTVSKIFMVFPGIKCAVLIVGVEIITVSNVFTFRTDYFIKPMFGRPAGMVLKISIQMPFTNDPGTISCLFQHFVNGQVFRRVQVTGCPPRQKISDPYPGRILSGDRKSVV